MGLIENLRKPEYVFRPRQVVTRIRNGSRSPSGSVQVRLPWGLPLTVSPNEAIGRSLWTMGVYDLNVTEALWRLVDPGEMAVDVGGNIGYMTSILAVRAGRRGRVVVFEAHPDVFADLQHNLASWAPHGEQIAEIAPMQVALGDVTGAALLYIAEGFEQNRGTARIAETPATVAQTIEVPVQRLDSILDTDRPIGVMKVDVEGFELNVLRGAQALLRPGGIRDIVFEEHDPYPTAVTDFLEAFGYTVFTLRQRLWGLVARSPREMVPERRAFDAQNLLATLDPERARSRLARLGWRSLSQGTRRDAGV